MPRKDGCRSTRPCSSDPRDYPEFHTILAVSSPAEASCRAAHRFMRQTSCQAGNGIGGRHEFPSAVSAPLHLDLALREPPRPHQDLPGDADEVGGGEFRARPLVEVVIERIDALGGEFG